MLLSFNRQERDGGKGRIHASHPVLPKRNRTGDLDVMARYRKFNPKRRLASPDTYTGTELVGLAKAVKYSGNPEHKRNPGDFGLTPPAVMLWGLIPAPLLSIAFARASGVVQ
ncbi:MAG: hypothetical protein OXC91_12375 [Rhodobacteraceae bacterium]|nr:hypothetical protein [Paracoccaceae bacterium]